MDENIKDCRHLDHHACGFQGEPCIEDCIFCLSTSAIASYRMALIHLGENVKLPFGAAYMIYANVDSASQKSNKFAELMEKHHPKTYERGAPRTISIIIGPNPLSDKNPLAR